MFNPTDLITAYRLAKIQKEKVSLHKKPPYWTPPYNTSTQPHEPAYLKFFQPSQTTDNHQNHPKAIVLVHKVSQHEMRERRAKGLWYSCDSKWALGHKCLALKLYLIEKIEKNHEVIDINISKEEGQLGKHQISVFGENLEINFHAIIGPFNHKTMWVVGRIGNQPVTILINSESTHNFLELSMLSKISLYVLTDDKVRMKVANGDQVQSEGRINDAPMVVHDMKFTADMYLLVLAGCDVVLGVQWLQGLTSMLWNFHNLTMQFTYQDTVIILKSLRGNTLMEEGAFNRAIALEKKKGSYCSSLNRFLKLKHLPLPLNPYNISLTCSLTYLPSLLAFSQLDLTTIVSPYNLVLNLFLWDPITTPTSKTMK